MCFLVATGAVWRDTRPVRDWPGCCAGPRNQNLLTKSFCNGNGDCIAGAASPCPDGFVCGATDCLKSCTTDAGCIAGYYWTGTVCALKKSGGVPCVAGNECTTGYCSDGVCCTTQCGGTFESCRAAHTGQPEGVCAPVIIDTDPASECQAGSVCGLTGNCSGTGACKYAPSGTGCGTTCTGNTLTTNLCNGNGTCSPGTTTSCANGLVCGTDQCKTSCVDSNDCMPAYYCAAGTCVVDKPNGQPCVAASQCVSGYCRDGYCCNSACLGPCAACSDALKGTTGKNGICGPIPANQDPDNDCAQSLESSCGLSGSCNGNGACALWAPGTQCVAPTCNNGLYTVSTCDGFGSCGATQTQCVPYTCAGAVCATSCQSDADCVGSYHCNTTNHLCVSDDGNGTPCTQGSQCASGNCVDSVCCDTACAGSCVACTALLKGAGADGVCGPVLPAQGVQPECPVQAAQTCGTTGTCNGAGACLMWVADTTCAPTTCTSGNQTAYKCNGLGACVSTTSPCSPFTCDGPVCATAPCATDAHCIPNYFCRSSDHTCQPDLATGATCVSPYQCASGNCVDGVCCDTACTGACRACSTDGHQGQRHGQRDLRADCLG